jgi:hypothetical protein
MHRIRTLLTAVTVTLAACGGDGGGIDGTTGPNDPVPANPVGTYTLKTVDGKPLPALVGKPVVEDGYTIEAHALSGKFVLYANQTYDFTAKTEIVAKGIDYKATRQIDRAGTYAFDATTITLKSSDGVVSTMTRAGTTLTANVSAPAADGGTETVTMVFSR